MIQIGKTTDGKPVGIPLKFINRHGLITGATGTGKTVTLQALAEQFSAAGIPVFAADVKGDLSGIATACPAALWDVFGKFGHPVNTSVDQMGATLMARMLGVNPTQEAALVAAIKHTADQKRWLLDLDRLRWQLLDMSTNREDYSARYGNITTASINTVQRHLLTLEAQGGNQIFNEPPLEISDLMRTVDGKGVVNLLHADNIMEAPRLYATLLYWLLTELFRQLPEVGDEAKPRMVFFFDEAHLLFRDAPKPLVEAIERLVRLIRSKGVGVFFVTQSVADVPDAVLRQLGNRIQHALRAYTPTEQRFVKASVAAFRPNPGVDVAASIIHMGVGEALVSPLVDDGVPMPVERVKIEMPNGKIGPITPEERQAIIDSSPLKGKYQRPEAIEGSIRAFYNRKRAEAGLEPLRENESAAADNDDDGSIELTDILAPLAEVELRQERAARWKFWRMVISISIGIFMVGFALVKAGGG